MKMRRRTKRKFWCLEEKKGGKRAAGLKEKSDE